MTDAVTVTREFTAPQARLWRALTNGPLLAEWLMDNDFQPVQGHRFQFRAKPMPHWDGVVEAEVLAIQPETHLSLRFDTGSMKTTLTFTLSPLPTGVRLQVEQRGFTEAQAQNRQGAEWGWPRNLDRLAQVLSKEA